MERLEVVERDLRDHAKSISALTEEIAAQAKLLAAITTNLEVRKERDRYLDERLDRIEASIAKVYNLGWWLLITIGASFIAAVMGFALRGGFNVIH